MPSNKFILEDKGKLLKNKLDRLSTSLQGALESSKFLTQEQYLTEAFRLVKDFHRSLQEPTLELESIRADDLPDPALYNQLWNQVLDDLIMIFSELENVEDLTVGNFNFLSTESNRLTARLKSVSSKLGDYILYSLNASKDAFFFKDSFNDLSKVDINSPLLNKDECDISQEEGIISLPINRDEDSFIVIKESPSINPNSNGTIGNNQELNAAYNGNVQALLDNNPDTWFEYERVVSLLSDDQADLLLDLTLNLGEEKVINHIRINPNNFGTKTVIKIDSIDTSLDGQVYTSIKDDIPIADFIVEDEENIFNLAPSTSKFAGQGIYTFTPRKVKYIRFVFRQAEAFTIETPAGQKLRYAIGLRDINIRGLKYKSEGELISNPFQLASEIRKVSIESNQNPSEPSELVSIQYFISPDNGASWHEIQPKGIEPVAGVVSIPEILEFNGPSVDTIETSVPVKSIRIKTVLTRNDDQFIEGSSALRKQIDSKAEMHSVPRGAPFTLELEEDPVDGTIVVVDPLFGSRGLPAAPYILGHGTDKADTRKFRLPFVSLPRPVKKVSLGGTPTNWTLAPTPANEWVHVEVGGEEWTQATSGLSLYNANYNTSDTERVYTLDVNRGIIEFGNGQNTLAPPPDAPITVYFDAERLFPSENEDAHVARLDFSTSNNKEDFVIKRYDEVERETEILPRKATVVRLKHDEIVDDSNIATVISGLATADTQKTFINGKDELIISSDWSMDKEKGIIYLATPTPDNQDTTVSYTHQPITILSVDEWDWGTTDLFKDSVKIKETAWKTRTITEEEVPVGSGNTKVIDLSKLSVEKGTLVLRVSVSGVNIGTDDNANPFFKEVDFINGIEELGGSTVQTTEAIEINLVSGVNPYVEYTLKEAIVTDENFVVGFSNTAAFTTKLDFVDTVNAPGEYYLNRSTRTLQFYGTYAANPGKITYFYSEPNFSENGLYSVDYRHGRIYTQKNMNPTGLTSSLYRIFATYEWSDFRAEYRIARLLNPASYNVDITNKTVTIKDAEILKKLQLPQNNISAVEPYYIINYDYVSQTRENIEELLDFFSPIVKDYAAKVLLKGNIF